jgi:hypothetical protein
MKTAYSLYKINLSLPVWQCQIYSLQAHKTKKDPFGDIFFSRAYCLILLDYNLFR